jgi:SagB-type dehydrogenase family enzyme
LHPTAPVVFVLTSIAWREAWKYQDRAYRYCLLDIGHAWQSLALAARAIGCRAAATAVFSDNSVTTLCQLPPDEWPMLIVAVSGSGIRLRESNVDGLDAVAGQPNVLSERQVLYPSIEAVHTATSLHEGTAIGQFEIALHGKAASRGGRPFGEVVRGRRSALDFIAGRSEMPRSTLLDILRVSAPGVIDLYVYVHRVKELAPGLYIYSAVADRLDLIRAGDQRVIAAALSLQQELAGNACVAISMVANLEQLTAKHGPRGYRYAHFEAGAIGQRMYVAAESVGLRATGMGAFFDEEVSRYLNLSPAEGEVVYHFAIGYPVHDARLDALA